MQGTTTISENFSADFSASMLYFFSLSMALQAFGPWPLFQFLNPIHIGRTFWTGDQSVSRPLPAHKTTQTQNKRTQTSMPRLGFEPTTPAFERAKTVHALDRAATVVGMLYLDNLFI
jgi:hypothetical protein